MIVGRQLTSTSDQHVGRRAEHGATRSPSPSARARGRARRSRAPSAPARQPSRASATGRSCRRCRSGTSPRRPRRAGRRPASSGARCAAAGRRRRRTRRARRPAAGRSRRRRARPAAPSARRAGRSRGRRCTAPRRRPPSTLVAGDDEVDERLPGDDDHGGMLARRAGPPRGTSGQRDACRVRLCRRPRYGQLRWMETRWTRSSDAIRRLQADGYSGNWFATPTTSCECNESGEVSTRPTRADRPHPALRGPVRSRRHDDPVRPAHAGGREGASTAPRSAPTRRPRTPTSSARMHAPDRRRHARRTSHGSSTMTDLAERPDLVRLRAGRPLPAGGRPGLPVRACRRSPGSPSTSCASTAATG